MSEYIIGIGKKYKGKKLSEVPRAELVSYIAWLDGQALAPDSPMAKSLQELKDVLAKTEPTAPIPIETKSVSGRKPGPTKHDPYKGTRTNGKPFHTPKGTELIISDIKGKDYLEVKWRLVWFREEKPNWSIETEYVQLHEKYAQAKATIRDESGRIVSTAHKFENIQGFGDFTEKAETGAIGRALAFIGYGTQFCVDELDEGTRIVDAPIETNRHPSEPDVPRPENGAVISVNVPKTDKATQTRLRQMGFVFDWETSTWVRYFDERFDLGAIGANFEIIERPAGLE